MRALARQPLFPPEALSVLDLLKDLQKSGKNIALLMDEYGGLQGLITAADILKALLGEVSYDETPNAVQQSDGPWLVDGMLSLDEFKNALKLTGLDKKETRSVETAGGFMLVLFGRIPSEGDVVNLNRYRFEIIDLDG